MVSKRSGRMTSAQPRVNTNKQLAPPPEELFLTLAHASCSLLLAGTHEDTDGLLHQARALWARGTVCGAGISIPHETRHDRATIDGNSPVLLSQSPGHRGCFREFFATLLR